MANANLFFAVIWLLMVILAIVGMFWNPSLIILGFLAGFMSLSFFSEWNKDRKNNK